MASRRLVSVLGRRDLADGAPRRTLSCFAVPLSFVVFIPFALERAHEILQALARVVAYQLARPSAKERRLRIQGCLNVSYPTDTFLAFIDWGLFGQRDLQVFPHSYRRFIHFAGARQVARIFGQMPIIGTLAGGAGRLIFRYWWALLLMVFLPT